MNCDQIIYLGIFAIVAIYLYQNCLTPQREYFNVGANVPMGNSNHNSAVHNANVAATNANMAAKANANSAVNAAQRAARSNAAASAKATPQTAPGVRASEPLPLLSVKIPLEC